MHTIDEGPEAIDEGPEAIDERLEMIDEGLAALLSPRDRILQAAATLIAALASVNPLSETL